MNSRFRTWLLRCVAGAALVSGAASAQFPQPLLDPDLQLKIGGDVRTLVEQPDGALLIGGHFDSINGVPRANLARLLPDGSLDPDWNPAPDGYVAQIALDRSGAVYVSGAFGHIGGQSRSGLAKLGADGRTKSWVAQSNIVSLTGLAIDAAGDVYVAGYIDAAPPAPAGHAPAPPKGGTQQLAKFRGLDGALVPQWAPTFGAFGAVYDMKVHGEHLYLGGYFTVIGGAPRQHLAKLTLDDATPVDWAPAADAYVDTLEIAGDFLYVGGNFARIGGQDLPHLARIGLDSGNVDAAWVPTAPDDDVVDIAFDDDGALVLAGYFTHVGSAERWRAARLDAAGQLVADWAPRFDARFESVSVVETLAGDLAYFGGNFRQVSGDTRLGLAIVDARAALGARRDVELPGEVRSLAAQPDRGVIVAGSFHTANGEPRRELLRLTASGALDPDWRADIDAEGTVYAIATDALGDVYAGGRFRSVNGESVKNLVKLDAASGRKKADWNHSTDQEVYELALDAAGNLYIGGNFRVVDTTAPRTYLARILADGRLSPWTATPAPAWPADALVAHAGHLYVSDSGNGLRRYAIDSDAGTQDGTWNPAPNAHVNAMVADAAAHLYVAGWFHHIGGADRYGLARLSLSGTGAADPGWNPLTVDDRAIVDALALGDDGRLYAGGRFWADDGVSANFIRFTPDGLFDPSWQTSPNAAVSAVAVRADGVVAVGGAFDTIAGEARQRLAYFAERHRLRLDPVQLAPGYLGTPYLQPLSASGGLAPYHYRLEGTLPAGLAFDADSGTIGGTPGESGTFLLTVSVSDEAGIVGAPFTGARAYLLQIGEVAPPPRMFADGFEN